MTRSCLALLALLLLAPTAHADKCKPVKGNIAVSIKPDASLYDLGVWVSAMTCKNVVYGSDVVKHATTLTVIAPPGTITPKQAVQLFVDAVQGTGLVVTQKASSFVISLGPKMPKGCPDLTIATAPTATPDPADTSTLDDEMQKVIDRGITKVDDTHYKVSAEMIDKITQNPMAVAKGARVVPAMKDGKAQGFKLYAIRPNSVWAKLGISNGDTLAAINGLELTSAEKGLEVYTKIREAKVLVVDMIRRGKPLTITYTITK